MAKKKTTRADVETVEASLTRTRNQLARVKERESDTLCAVIEKGAMTVTSILMGAFEDKISPTVAKVPTKVVLGTLAYGLAAIVPPRWLSSIAEGIGDSMFSTYEYKSAVQVRKKLPSPFIAGEDE